MGIAVALFIGKQVGVFGAAWVMIRLGAVPIGATLSQLYGVALLCGIGFTMSLFIGVLAFPARPNFGCGKSGSACRLAPVGTGRLGGSDDAPGRSLPARPRS